MYQGREEKRLRRIPLVMRMFRLSLAFNWSHNLEHVDSHFQSNPAISIFSWDFMRQGVVACRKGFVFDCAEEYQCCLGRARTSVSLGLDGSGPAVVSKRAISGWMSPVILCCASSLARPRWRGRNRVTCMHEGETMIMNMSWAEQMTTYLT